MISIISISQQHLLDLERIAKESYPVEACAVLEGTLTLIDDESSERANVLGIVPMRNADESIYTFRIDTNDLINTYEEISSRNMEVVGIFHSHSSNAYPSLTDRKYMELNPVVWLIYSTLSQNFSAYILDDIVIQIRLEFSSSNHAA
ncbi:MAG: M67 family metallopeptidase [Nitrososphaeraceae archaeon]